jgi:serine/threonine-protein kinase
LVFEEETFIATILAHAQKPPIPPSKRTEIEIPPQLEKLVMWCLEKEPRDRPSSAGEIRRAISQFALADSWTPEKAEKWWKLHMPEKTVAGVEVDLKERGLQANVQQI